MPATVEPPALSIPSTMHFLKAFFLTIVASGLFSSCDLFNSNKEDRSRGEVLWRVEHQTGGLVGTQPLISENKVYFIQDRRLKSYMLERGEQVWSVLLKERGLADYSRKLLQDGENIYIDLGNEFRAYNLNSGTKMWITPSNSTPEEQVGFGFPIMSQDSDHLYAGRRGYVLKLRRDNGQIMRRFELDRLVPQGVTQGATEPIISPFGDNILYVPTSYYDRTTPGEEEFGGNMFAFDAASGEVIWETRVEFPIDDTRTEMPGDSVVVSPPIEDIEVTESSIVALQGKAIVVLDRFTGNIRWHRYLPDSGFDVGLAVEDDGVYAASTGTIAHKLSLQTGEVLWQQDIRFSNTSIPTVQNGRMYFNNSGGGGIWVLDTEDGSVIYHQNTPNYNNDSFDVYISSLGVGEGYMVNVGSKAVYCLTVP